MKARLWILGGLALASVGASVAEASIAMEVKGDVVQISPTAYKVKTARGPVVIQRRMVPEEIRKTLETGNGRFHGFVPKDAVDRYYPTDRKIGVRK
jgi:hypothetical protein